MNELTGKVVNIVLAIEEGKNLGISSKNQIFISGNFNGRVLDSDKIQAIDENPTFNTELIWEIEKRDLRKIRSANHPLRVECCCADPTVPVTERLGFCLLSLRSANIITNKNTKSTIPYKWQKLIGSQKTHKKSPELYISLTIRDHNEESVHNPSFISEELSVPIPRVENIANIPIKYLEDGFIKIGDRAENSFSIILFIKTAANFDTLLPEVLVFQNNTDKYYLVFKIFGISIKTKPFTNELHELVHLNEKIVVRILSSLDELKAFFENVEIEINFRCGSDILGTTIVDLKGIIVDDTETTWKKSDRCFFKFPSEHGIVPVAAGNRSPFIDVDKGLKMFFDTATERMEMCPSPAAGDQISSKVMLSDLQKIEHQEIKSERSELVPLGVEEMFRSFNLNVTLNSLIWTKAVDGAKVFFKFVHPVKDSSVSIVSQLDSKIGTEILLVKTGMSLDYISTNETVNELIRNSPPKLILQDLNENAITKEYCFDTTLILDEENFTYRYNFTMTAVDSSESVAKINATLSMCPDNEDNFRLKLSPALVDDVLTVQQVLDLERWKKEERCKFEAMLNRVKRAEIAKLKTEFDERKAMLEDKLNANISKCKNLQEELQNKLNHIKMKQNSRKKSNYQEIFKANWQQFGKSENAELIEKLSLAQRDNENLQNTLEDFILELESYKKKSLTKEQTTNLLQELRVLEDKFEEAQKAKSYFKQQWKTACDEIHNLRTEDYKQLTMQLRQNKERLSQLSLDTYLGFDSGSGTFRLAASLSNHSLF